MCTFGIFCDVLLLFSIPLHFFNLLFGQRFECIVHMVSQFLSALQGFAKNMFCYSKCLIRFCLACPFSMVKKCRASIFGRLDGLPVDVAIFPQLKNLSHPHEVVPGAANSSHQYCGRTSPHRNLAAPRGLQISAWRTAGWFCSPVRPLWDFQTWLPGVQHLVTHGSQSWKAFQQTCQSHKSAGVWMSFAPVLGDGDSGASQNICKPCSGDKHQSISHFDVH